ncbi:DUF4123 domain-containing protein [Pseudomonas stutzeri]|uniref:DUF4123 domain-containing protein n=1 Tax=Stutzerimonas stutzeri TaxID=316 RepID=A0A2N8RX44_STUST|nr:DUF4123 domain-containing protein [Stutzerimonas stutzeri]MCQ4298051.1 DUF4123 domain-containing protein [Stutzerimonas stutzeri]PNF78922.1 hypothetical protein CXK92_20480 [Stutzerimonas stutzeri]
MNDRVEHWLSEQQAQSRPLLLVIDSLAEPTPLPSLFSTDLVHSYANLYKGTEVDEMAGAAPWLILLNELNFTQLRSLTDAPEQNWGWLASVDHADMAALTQHWQARIFADEQGQRSLYRFQDNRIIARHLGELDASQRPLLLGPLASVLCWDGQDWQWFDNDLPGEYREPFEKPWLSIPEPEQVQRAVAHHNLELWLWQNHTEASTRLAETRVVSDWLDHQLDKAKEWHWHSEPQLHFLLRYQLDPALAEHPAWLPADQETPEAHYSRVRSVLTPSHSARD